jgi:hypothetical protein
MTLHRFQLLAPAAAALLAGTAIAACGSNASNASNASNSSSAGVNPTPAHAQQEALNFSRCMRSHGVPNFPDPTATGGINFNVPGINSSSPSFEAAQTACKNLLPVKSPPAGPPAPHAHAQLIQLAKCMRTHGYPGLPDPRPGPPPSNAGFGTAFGLGAYYIGIPDYMKAHSPAFIHALEACHERP